VLVVLGLLISIPVVIWGSTQILKLVERFPSITYLGAGVLAWTAAKMITTEPMVRELAVFQNPAFDYAIQALVILGVLGGGFIRSRLALEKLIAPAIVVPAISEIQPQQQPHTLGDTVMNKILIPVDDSSNTLLALQHGVFAYGKDANTEFHICNVQPKIYRHIGKFFSPTAIKEWQEERAYFASKSAADFLQRAGVSFSFTCVTGDKGEALRAEAARLGCTRIVIGSAKKNTLSRLFENSTTAKLLEISDIPVEVITGKTLPLLERWGIPAIGAGAVTALMVTVID
jgi:nucleotide-binding universal stress UspA family protein